MTDTSIRVESEQRRRLKVYAAERDISQGEALGLLLDQQDDLQELVQEWREFAEPNGWDEYSDGVRDASVSCADELQDVLEGDV